MSIKQAQEWLNQRPDIDELYTVMVQCESGENTRYRLIWSERPENYLTRLINHADWGEYSFAYAMAKSLIGSSQIIEKQEYEVTRAFIVEKGEDYRVIEEVHADAAES